MLTLTEIALTITVIPMALKITGDSIASFFWESICWPVLMLRKFAGSTT